MLTASKTWRKSRHGMALFVQLQRAKKSLWFLLTCSSMILLGTDTLSCSIQHSTGCPWQRCIVFLHTIHCPRRVTPPLTQARFCFCHLLRLDPRCVTENRDYLAKPLSTSRSAQRAAAARDRAVKNMVKIPLALVFCPSHPVVVSLRGSIAQRCRRKNRSRNCPRTPD